MKRLLVVEDYPDFLSLLHDYFVREHYEVVVADDGTMAKQILSTQSFDVIILDWELPGITGYQLCREFREEGGKTPIIMLTGKRDISSKTQCFEAGADDYLTKPFHMKELAVRVKALLRRTPEKTNKGLTNADVAEKGWECLIGSSLDERLQIESFVGEGNMGFVFRARHIFLNKIVAVKVLQPRFVFDAMGLGRFRQEAQMASALSHPNVVALHDLTVSSGGIIYLVMDYVDGVSFSNVLRAQKVLQPERAIRLFMQVCDGLSHAHLHGIVHRDVKPSNLMLVTQRDGSEVLKVVDFGIAKINDPAIDAQLTRNGEVFGSPQYMSPEQAKGLELDRRSDIFSLGCVMFEALAGRPPFNADSLLETMWKRTAEPAPLLTKARPDLRLPKSVADSLEKIVAKSLERDLNQRYQTMDELKVALELLATSPAH